MTLKMKLISTIAMFCLVVGILMIGVLAASQQTLTMQGSVNFVVADKSLYVKDVRIKQDNNSEPSSISSFMPGYINGNFDLDLTGIANTNTYGSFALYFDIINTTDIPWTISSYTLSQELQDDGVLIEYSGVIPTNNLTDTDDDGFKNFDSSTPIDGTLVVTIIAPNSTTIDLSGITIVLDEAKRYDGLEFIIDDSTKTATLSSYVGVGENVDIPTTIGGVKEEKLDSFEITKEEVESTMEKITQIQDITNISALSKKEMQILTMGLSDFTIVGYEEYDALIVELSNEFYRVSKDFSNFFNNANFSYPLTIQPTYSLTLDQESVMRLYQMIVYLVKPSGWWHGTIEITDGNYKGEYLIQEFVDVIMSATETSFNVKYSPFKFITSYEGTIYSVNKIAEFAFAFNSKIKSVKLSENITEIEPYAFYYCSGLEGELKIPNSVTTIGSAAFEKCSSLTSIILSENITHLEKSVFYYCTSLEDINIPQKVVSIGEDAFTGCSALTSLIIPDNVTSIGPSAFHSCNGLESVNIPGSVISIGSSAFYGCRNLIEINFNAKSMDDLESENFVFYNAGQDGKGIMVNIGAEVTKIPAYLFQPYPKRSYSPKITSVIFAEGSQCEIIGSYAFYDCGSLTSVTFGENPQLTSIGDSAFRNCSGLTSVKINEYIYKNASSYSSCGYILNNITSGETVYVPQSVVDKEGIVMGNYLSDTYFTRSEQPDENGYYVFTRR